MKRPKKPKKPPSLQTLINTFKRLNIGAVITLNHDKHVGATFVDISISGHLQLDEEGNVVEYIYDIPF